MGFRAATYGQNPDPANQQQAYQSFMKAKAAVLAGLIKAFGEGGG
jgi:hypothetical protein